MAPDQVAHVARHVLDVALLEVLSTLVISIDDLFLSGVVTFANALKTGLNPFLRTLKEVLRRRSPSVDFVFRFLLGDAVFLLNKPDEAVALAFHSSQIVVGQPTPTLLNLTLDIVPPTLEL